MLKKILTSPFFPVIGLVLCFGLAHYAKSVPELWTIFLPVATATCIRIFDFLLPELDFQNMDKLTPEGKNMHILALAIISAGMAIAVAIFLK
jgi:hypothetical protein